MEICQTIKLELKLQLMLKQALLEGSTISIGAELAGAAGARAPPLFDPRPEIL